MKNLQVKPLVNKEGCMACGLCAENCPSNAIRIDDVAEINYDKCMSCGNCARIYPQNAIILTPTQFTEAGCNIFTRITESVLGE